MKEQDQNEYRLGRRRLLQGLVAAGLGAWGLAGHGGIVRAKRSDGDFWVDIDPLETRYRVGEPIRFRVRGNQPFYLYLYSLDDGAGGASTLILPNRRAPDNHFNANRSYIVPGRTVEFVGDKPGRERLVMVASKDDLSFDLSPYRPSGDFSLIGPEELEQLFSAKGIRIRDRGPAVEGKNVVVREFNLLIEEDPWQRPPLDLPAVFLSTAKYQYVAGEELTLLFGADRPGWVHLYVVEPGGSFDWLETRKVAADRTERLKTRVEGPYGMHHLIAIYSEQAEIKEERIAAIAIDPQRAMDAPPEGFGVDVQTIRVSRYRDYSLSR
ncbi:MAG: DUF4384 domain-containing protein [Gammaproteobacteria bacterium]|nr:DUF4384 domain-containing protein [Gammaproteobacteria bacterium]MBU1655026.1 DUF4384 domain-containing protein [Gammaproteobacteria bacterium]MBU1961523.1 DUF4384 domain-containing protein [Gammaproteobacteria bacterium]